MGKTKELERNAAPRILERGSAAEAEDTKRLHDTIAGFQMQLSDFIATSDDMLEKAQSKEGLAQESDHYMGMYDRMMLMSCLRPLMSGLSAHSVLYAAGTYLGYRAMGGTSPFSGAQETALADAFDPTLKELRDINDASWRAAGASQAGNLRERVMALGGKAPERPLSPEAAAIISMGLDKQAYMDMRQPGADVQGVRDKLAKAQSNLEALCDENGISLAALDANKGRLAARLEGSGYEDMYAELVRSGGRPEVGADGIHTGAWHLDGLDASYGFGAFTVRQPYTPSSLRQEMLGQTMLASQGVRDFVKDAPDKAGWTLDDVKGAMHFTPEELSTVSEDYRMAIEAMRQGTDASEIQGVSANMDSSLRAYGAAFKYDGLTDVECKQALVGAMNDTMAYVSANQPEVFAEWRTSREGRRFQEWVDGVLAHDADVDAGFVGQDEAATPAEDAPEPEFVPGGGSKPAQDADNVYDEGPVADDGPTPHEIVLANGKAAGMRRRSFNAIRKREAARELMGEFHAGAMADGVITDAERREGCELSAELAAACESPAVGLDGLSR